MTKYNEKILVVDSEETTRELLGRRLSSLGYSVFLESTAKKALVLVSKEHPDLIILDILLPKVDGYELCRKLRQGNQTPIIILTPLKDISARIMGLDAGADDYLTKPFDLDELCARMRALQRRSKARAKPVLVYGNISLDPASHVVTLNDEEVMISRREFALLQKLLENSGRVISREQLNQTLYGWGENIDSNALEVHIHNLRKRFGNNVIRTIRGVGYMAEKVSESEEMTP